MDWSYELLDDDERRVFCGLSLFDESFSLTSAAAVAGAPSDTARTEEIVLALVDKSMLISSPYAARAGDGTCLRLPGLLRRYSCERLAEMADSKHVHARHALEMLRLFRAGAQEQVLTAAT